VPLPQDFSQATVRLLAGVSSEGSNEGGSPSQFTHMVVVRIQFLTGNWTKGLSSSLAGNEKPPSAPHHMAWASHWAAYNMASTRASKQGKREHTREKVHSLCYLISEVASYTFAIFYLSEMSLQVQSTLKGRELHKGMNTRR